MEQYQPYYTGFVSGAVGTRGFSDGSTNQGDGKPGQGGWGGGGGVICQSTNDTGASFWGSGATIETLPPDISGDDGESGDNGGTLYSAENPNNYAEGGGGGTGGTGFGAGGGGGGGGGSSTASNWGGRRRRPGGTGV